MTDRHPQDGAHEFDELEPLPDDTVLHEVEELEEFDELEEHSEMPETPEFPESPAMPEVPEMPGAAAAEPPPPPEEAPAALVEEPPPAPVEEGEPVAAAAAIAPVAQAAADGDDGSFQPGMVKASTGSRRERMEKDRAERKTRKKSHNWDRWPGPGPKPTREMEKAPLLLRKAAWWLMIGCVFPWGGFGDKWYLVLLEKVLIAAGLFVWHQTHLLRDGTPTQGFIQKLGEKSFKPLFITAGLLVLLGFAPVASWGDHTAFAEKGFLILAGLTYTHIYDYEHGGRFNPMFPIMFLAPGLGGLFALVKIFSESPSIRIQEILAGVGAALVSIAGWIAAYTMYVALKEAKAEGDRKKAAAVEARKAARTTRGES